MKRFMKILPKNVSSFITGSITGFLICIAGCMPVKKVEPPTSSQLKRQWEKDNLLNLLSKDRVKRKDIAFFLVYYLNDLLPFFEKQPSLYPIGDKRIKDIKGLNEETYIVKALKMGWMSNFPDGKFYPDDKIKRFQLAIILFRVSKTLPFFSGNNVGYCEIKDVPYSDYTYKVLSFVVLNNLLTLEDGFFFKDKSVTGREAAKCFSKFRKMLKK